MGDQSYEGVVMETNVHDESDDDQRRLLEGNA